MLVALIVLSLELSSAKSTDCTAVQGRRLTEEQMNPSDFHAYVRDAGLKTVDDVLCCLPKSYLSNFTIVHSSASAQTSDVDRPRLLVHNDLKAKDDVPTVPLQMVLTINGGGTDLNNTENMEILFNNQRAGEGELYDADFSGASPHVTKNPESCLRCHGDQGALPVGGPKMIFQDVDQWTNVVQGVHGCGNETSLSRAIERRVQKAFTTNPRYRCLDQDVATKDHLRGQSTSIAKDILPLHNALTEMNVRRYARYLRTTPDYDRYKYLAVGTLFCDEEAKLSNQRKTGRANLEGWIPKEARRNFREVSTLSEDLPTTEFLNKAHANLVRSEREMNRTDAKLAATAEALDRGEHPDIDFYHGPLDTCGGGMGPVSERRFKQVKSSLNGPPTLDAYKIDTALRGYRGSAFNPLFRYVFEARGVRVDGLSMEPLAEAYPTMPGGLDFELMKLEPPDSPLGRISRSLRPLFFAPPGHSPKEAVLTAAVTRACRQLKTLSREALSAPPKRLRLAEPAKLESTPSAR